MKTGFTKAVAGALMLSAAATVTATSAQAGGFAIREQSAEFLGMAFAGNAAGGQGLSSMFWNPATVTDHDGLNSESNASLIIPDSRTTNATITPAVAVGPNSGNIGQLALVPASYYNYQVNEKIYLGLAINSPFGLTTEAERAYVGTTHALKSRIFNANATPMIGFKLSPALSFGFGFQIDYIDGALTNAGAPNSTVSVTRLKGDDWGVGIVAGLSFDLTDSTRVGIGWRSAIKHKLKGHFATNVTVPVGAGVIVVPTLVNATARLELPQTATLSVRQKVTDQLTVNGTIEWAQWSVLQNLVIVAPPLPNITQVFNWDDSWFFSLGGEYKINDALTVRAGVAYEDSPVQTRNRTPRLPDNNRIWLSVGGSYQATDWLKLHAGYSHIFFEDGDIAIAATPTNPLALNATFKQDVDIVSVSATIDSTKFFGAIFGGGS